MDVFINPYTDFGFKKLFGEEKNKHLLISFLNDLLGDKETVTDLTFKNTEQLPSTSASRKAIYDIYCTNDQGDHFIVELQKAKQNYFKDRTVYYSTFPIQSQAQTGEWDFKLKAVYCIGILDFVFDKNAEPEVIHTVELKNQHDQLFYDKLKYIYLEMPNFDLTLEQLDSHRDRWLYFIKNLANLHEIPELFKDDIIYEGFETAKIAALNKTEQAVYQQSLKDYRDLYNVVNTSHKEGYEEGIEQGEANADEKHYQKTLQSVKIMLKMAMSVADIAKALQLSEDEIRKIQTLLDSDSLD